MGESRFLVTSLYHSVHIDYILPIVSNGLSSMASEGSATYGSFSLDSSLGTHSSSFPSSSLPSTEDYLDIDDILATEQRVPVEFVATVYRLGFLNSSSTEGDLNEGLTMELPFWLAKRLATRTTNRLPIVSIDLPSCYNKKQRDILSADANVVDLYGKEPYYYLLGLKLVQCNHMESMDLSQSLLETFLNRFRKIMDHSQNSFQADTYTTTCKLDETERHLFKAGQDSADKMEKWGRGKSHKLRSLHGRKRKKRPSQ